MENNPTLHGFCYLCLVKRDAPFIFFVGHHILCIRVYAEAHLEFPTKILQDKQIFIYDRKTLVFIVLTSYIQLCDTRVIPSHQRHKENMRGDFRLYAVPRLKY